MGLPALDASSDAAEFERMAKNAERAADFLKALGHEGRLLILCSLADRERSVTELEQMLGQRQAAVSQQLARLRHEGLVQTRREGKAIYYRLSDGRARRLLDLIYDMFCAEDAGETSPGA